MDKGKHIYKCGEGGMKMFGGTEKFGCVGSGALKNW